MRDKKRIDHSSISADGDRNARCECCRAAVRRPPPHAASGPSPQAQLPVSAPTPLCPQVRRMYCSRLRLQSSPQRFIDQQCREMRKRKTAWQHRRPGHALGASPRHAPSRRRSSSSAPGDVDLRYISGWAALQQGGVGTGRGTCCDPNTSLHDPTRPPQLCRAYPSFPSYCSAKPQCAHRLQVVDAGEGGDVRYNGLEVLPGRLARGVRVRLLLA